MSHLIPEDPWSSLRAHTPARIALGRVGNSLPTQEILKFGMSHAQARDAVLRPLDIDALQTALQAAGYRTMQARSLAPDRQTYLLRPDKGRELHEESRQALGRSSVAVSGADLPSLAIVIADGLSAIAVERHALPLLNALRECHPMDWSNTPVVIATQARVALGDPIGEALGASVVVVLIGERPGLSSPDSLGIYLTWAPRSGRMDSERNCISNVRPEGLSYDAAARKLHYLLHEAARLQCTGVALKDGSADNDDATLTTISV